MVSPDQVIDELLTGIELIDQQDEPGLLNRIKDQSFFRNFISLEREIAPDGENMDFVGFASTKRSVGLTRHRQDIELVPTAELPPPSSTTSPIIVEGILDYATAKRSAQAVGLTTDEGDEYLVVTPQGLEDLVRNHFLERVRVRGMYDQTYIHLSDVEAVDD